MKKIFLTMALAIGLMGSAQVKIGARPTEINAASILELESTTQGVLFPRVILTSTLTPTLAGDAHVAGMTVYNVGPATGDVTPGMYTNDGTKWVKLGASIYSNVRTVTSVPTENDFLITDQFVIIKVAGVQNITLPSPTLANTGRVITIRNGSSQTGSNGAYTITGNIPLGSTSILINKAQTYISDGTSWYLMSF